MFRAGLPDPLWAVQRSAFIGALLKAPRLYRTVFFSRENLDFYAMTRWTDPFVMREEEYLSHLCPWELQAHLTRIPIADFEEVRRTDSDEQRFAVFSKAREQEIGRDVFVVSDFSSAG